MERQRAGNAVTSPNVGTDINLLLGVTAVSANDVWAVGAYSPDQTLIERWNGTEWTVVYKSQHRSG